MATLEDYGGLPPVPEGQVTVDALDGKWAGWLRVSIGRRKYTKRFNLSAAEAAQLWELLGNTQFSGVSGELSGWILPVCWLRPVLRVSYR